MLPDLHGGDVGIALVLDIAHRAATAGAIHQPHHGQAQVVRHLLGVDQLLSDRAVVGAATHGEVVAHQHHRAAVQLGATHHQVGGREAHQAAVAVVLAAAGERAHLAEGGSIGDRVDALAHGQLAGVLVALDLVGAAELSGELLAIGQFIDFGLPGHVGLLSAVVMCVGSLSAANVPGAPALDFIVLFIAR